MDFTKITPVEFNGQRVAPVSYLTDYLVETCGITGLAARTRIANAQRKFTKEEVDYFKVSGYQLNSTNPAYQNFYTNSGVLKLSNFSSVSPLKDFAAQYFDTDALPATEPAAVSEVAQVETPDVTELIPVEWSAQRVLTTEQLAQFYQCNTDNIKVNFNANKENFIAGKHYFKLEGEELNNLRVRNSYLQISPKTRVLYLWTREGAVRHCKMLNTVKAWEMFNLLEDNYFNGAKPVEVQTPFDYEDRVNESYLVVTLSVKAREFEINFFSYTRDNNENHVV